MSVILSASIIVSFTLHRRVASVSRPDYLDVVSVEQAPYLAIVLCTNSELFCTGTVVDEWFVLTTAHCFYDTDGVLTEDDTTVLVIAGTDNLETAARDLHSGVAQIRQSVKLIVYSTYHFSENFVGDLALVKLDNPLEFTKKVAKAPFDQPPGAQNETLLSCTVFGFGSVLMFDENVHDKKLKKQKVVVGKYCNCLDEIWSIRWHGNVFLNTLICEYRKDGVKSPFALCSGDQGAPLVCNRFLRGVGTAVFTFKHLDTCSLSYGGTYEPEECGSPHTMNVFTDLCLYSEWLRWYIPDFPVLSENCVPIF